MFRGASHPAWGEWIEIVSESVAPAAANRLTPHGVSGLKFDATNPEATKIHVSPRMG